MSQKKYMGKYSSIDYGIEKMKELKKSNCESAQKTNGKFMGNAEKQKRYRQS